jgi:hypothetical protein
MPFQISANRLVGGQIKPLDLVTFGVTAQFTPPSSAAARHGVNYFTIERFKVG